MGDYQLNKAKYQRMLLESYWHQLETNHQLVTSYPLVPNRTFRSLLQSGLIFELLVDYLARIDILIINKLEKSYSLIIKCNC